MALTLAERKQKLLDQLASVEEVQSGTDRIRQASKSQIIAALQEIERQELAEASSSRVVVTRAKLVRV